MAKRWFKRVKEDVDSDRYPVRIFPNLESTDSVVLGLDPRQPELGSHNLEDITGTEAKRRGYHPSVFGGMFPAGLDTRTTMLRKKDLDAREGERGGEKHQTEQIWVTHAGIVLAAVGSSKRTQQFLCPRCGETKDTSKGRLIRTKVVPYSALICKSPTNSEFGCKDRNSEDNPYGAPKA